MSSNSPFNPPLTAHVPGATRRSGQIIYSRRFQFVAGPRTMVFEACEEHKHMLDVGPVSFRVIKAEPITTAILDKDEFASDHCQWCRDDG
jgi:hypothetical protein